eukprot:1157016-Pelagomonas_calceolata.AAC.9
MTFLACWAARAPAYMVRLQELNGTNAFLPSRGGFEAKAIHRLRLVEPSLMGKYAHRRDLLKVLLARCEQCNRLDLFFVEEEYMNDDERLCLRQYLRMVVDTLYMATHLRDGVPAFVASEKGVVVGRLTFVEDGDLINCSKMGVGGKAIPPNIDKVRECEEGPAWRVVGAQVASSRGRAKVQRAAWPYLTARGALQKDKVLQISQ